MPPGDQSRKTTLAEKEIRDFRPQLLCLSFFTVFGATGDYFGERKWGSSDRCPGSQII